MDITLSYTNKEHTNTVLSMQTNETNVIGHLVEIGASGYA